MLGRERVNRFKVGLSQHVSLLLYNDEHQLRPKEIERAKRAHSRSAVCCMRCWTANRACSELRRRHDTEGRAHGGGQWIVRPVVPAAPGRPAPSVGEPVGTEVLRQAKFVLS